MTKEQIPLFDDLPERIGAVSNHPVYRVWAAMMKRCHSPNAHNFPRYGGRGIYVCDEWRNSSFAFIVWAINAGWKPGLQIDRENNDGPYSPGNCRFVTARQNMGNRRATVRLSDGTPIAEAIRVAGWASRETVYKRLRLGWSPDDAVSIPKGGKRPAASAPSIPRGLVDLPAVDLPAPVFCPGYPASYLAKRKTDV